MTHQYYMISIMCEDTVGLVAKATGAIAELGGNIEEMYQGVLRGYFVLNLLISFDSPQPPEPLRKALDAIGADGLDFVVGILPRPEAELPPKMQGSIFILSIQGRDEPAILKRVTSYLAGRHINIEDISSWSGRDQYVITAQLTIPEEADPSVIRLDLAEILGKAADSVQLLHQDVFAATNRISMSPASYKD